MSPATPASTRWCPTTEQLMILEEMYKSGVRTPNATQIQHITAHLAYYGKIEGKNVFYWFQNHKARDRQKLRRKLINRQQQHLLQHHQQHVHEQPSTTIGIGPAGLHQFPHFLHEGAGGDIVLHQEEKQASQVMKRYKWTYDNIPERGVVLVNNHQMMEKSSQSPSSATTAMMYDRDWLMMMDVMSPPTTFQYPCCNNLNNNSYFNNTNDNKPILKTLELFPVKSTNLKDECRSTTTTIATSAKQQYHHFLSSATCSSTTTS
ncbi:hypothetical protein MKW94_009376 [Papaver nudicaule]|uniref:Homeobox domain-containing protein n=1 Tax=Papaver nudicaule TaxID=74823 RepID=A0AA41RYG9_PAPNU|nr:hypothetical protein [Papaver nudicaule]